jgi:hypothetical protein
MSGRVHTYVQETGAGLATPATLKKLHLNFTSISDAQRDDLKALIAAAAGGQCKYTDHESNVWKVRIVSTPVQFIQTGRQVPTLPAESGQYTRVFSVTLELEGWRM